MFEKAFQGAPSFEILSPQGSNPLALWKVNAGVQKVYDKALKASVYQLLPNGTHALMQSPKDERNKQGLGLVQPYLVLQVFLPQSRERPFSLEIGITDCSRTRRRLLFSAASREAQTNQQHARFPLTSVRRGTWLNLCFDIDSLVRGSFGQVMKSLDSVTVYSECRLRKIFTMRSLPQPCDEIIHPETVGAMEHLGESTIDGGGASNVLMADSERRITEPIPRSHDFPTGIEQHTQVIGAEQVLSSADELRWSRDELANEALRARDIRGDRQRNTSSPDAFVRQFSTNTPESPAQEWGGVGGRFADDEGDDSRISASRGRIAVQRLHMEPLSYDDMVRRASQHEDVVQEERDVLCGAQPEAVGSARRRLPFCAILPKTMRPSKSAEGDGQRQPPLRSVIPPISVPGPSTAASTRRPKSRRPEVRSPGDMGIRRLPLSARGAVDHSSPPPRPGRVRPLPLESGMARLVRDDSGVAPPQPFNASVAPSSARRGRRPGRPSPKTGDEASMSPSATRRRHDLAMRSLHKTAEVYGVPDVPHRYASLPKFNERTEEVRCVGGNRADEVDGDKLVSLSTLELPPEVMRSMRYSLVQGEADRQQARELGDDVGEPPPASAAGDTHVELPVQVPLVIPPPVEPSPTLVSKKMRLVVHESNPLVMSRSQESLPPMVQESGEAQHTGPVSPGFLLSPAQVLAAQAEADDEIVFYAPSRRPSHTSLPGDAGAHANGARSAFGATVRHMDGPPLSALFFADRQPGSHGNACQRRTISGGFALSLSPRVNAEAAPLGLRRAALPPAHAGLAESEPFSGDFCASSVRGEPIRGVPTLLGHDALVNPDAVAAAGKQGGLAESEMTCSTCAGCLLADAGISALGSVVAGTAARGTNLHSTEEQRRIKSLSPPRRWKRPEPFLNLDKETGGHLSGLSAPSSAPANTEIPRLEPFVHLHEPSAPSCPRGLYRSSRKDLRDRKDIALKLPPCDQPLPQDPPQRPFTPPVVSIGKLLRYMQEAHGTARGTRRQPLCKLWGPSAAALPVEVRTAAAEGTEGRVVSCSEADEADESMLEAIYDPMLDIYYDPRSNKYYEPKRSVA